MLRVRPGEAFVRARMFQPASGKRSNASARTSPIRLALFAPCGNSSR
jgi:hypothetical protein